MKWTNVECLNLISAYQQNPILWNPQHFQFTDKEKKQDAWVTLSRIFGCSSREVRKKIDSLLRSYRREKARTKKLFSNKSETHEPYVSSWFAYNKMSFLEDQLEIRTSPSSTDIPFDSNKYDDPLLKKEGSEQDCLNEALWAVEAVYHPEISVSDDQQLMQGLHRQTEKDNRKRIVDQWTTPEVPKGPKAKNPKLSDSRDFTFIDSKNAEESNSSHSIGSRNHSIMDNSVTYGQHIGNKLRQYDKRTKSIVEYQINNILFKADMGLFEARVIERSNKFNTFR